MAEKDDERVKEVGGGDFCVLALARGDVRQRRESQDFSVIASSNVSRGATSDFYSSRSLSAAFPH